MIFGLQNLPEKPRLGIGLVVVGLAVLGTFFGQGFWLRGIEFVVGIFIILAGIAILLKWSWDQSRRSFLRISVPENGYVNPDRDDNHDNPICSSVVILDVTVGDTDVELIDVNILRVKDGLVCAADVPEIRVDGDPVTVGSHSERNLVKPVKLKADGTHRLSYGFCFLTPLLNHYRAAQMTADGEIKVTLKYRFIDRPLLEEPVIKFFRHVSTAPRTQASTYKPISRFSPPPPLNDQILRAAWWRGWINRDDWRFARRFGEDERFVAVVRGRTGAYLDSILDADIERLRRINRAIQDQEASALSVGSRARDRFGGVLGTLASAAFFLRGLIRNPPPA